MDKWMQAWSVHWDPRVVRQASRTLSMTAAVATALLLAAMLFIRPSADADLARVGAAAEDPEEPAATREPFTTYKKAIGSKALFVAGSGPARPAGNASASSSVKNIALVGILSGATPQAILEDTVAKKTWYLGVGESMGGITVQSITDKAVVIEADGQTGTLTL
jgi:hypothetical protein